MIILKNAIKRKDNILYYINPEGDVCGAIMQGLSNTEYLIAHYELELQVLKQQLREEQDG